MVIGIDASRAFGSQRTGTENYSYAMIRELLALPEARKHEWILYTKFKAQTSNIKSNTKFKIQEIPLKYLWTQAGLAYRTWVDKLDVLWVPAHTLPLLRKPGLKTVVTIHGIEYEWLPAYENWLQRWYLPLSTQYAVKSASKIVAVSKFTRDQIVERMGGKPGKIEVIYEGTDDKFLIFNSKFLIKSKILNRYKLKPKKYLLFVGTVQPRKNLARLIEAFERAVADDKECKLVIAGKLGWNYEEVEKAVKKNPNVVITGYVSDEERQALLANALAYVQPSITEGFGLPIIEAFQAGLPVAASNGGALKEVAGDAALLFDPYNIEEMAKCLKRISSDKNLRETLAEKGKKRAKDFSWKVAAKEILNVFESYNS